MYTVPIWFLDKLTCKGSDFAPFFISHMFGVQGVHILGGITFSASNLQKIRKNYNLVIQAEKIVWMFPC